MTSRKKPAAKEFTKDSFQNFAASVGINAGNQSSGSGYGFNPITRIRLQLEWAYRGSWVVGRAVDVVAKDMTREGVTINSSDKPDVLQKFDKEVARLGLWKQLCDTVKWSRLYGGAIAFMMIDGQDPATPLRMETVGKGQFKGLLPMDRWLVQPSLERLVEDYGPSFGQPEFYTTFPDTMGMPNLRIHYTRVIRLEGIQQPYWQKVTENLWGISILERIWDRLVAYDSATQGIAQLVYKAHLRTYKVEGFRDIIAMGGKAMQALIEQMNMIRRFQSNEGLTLMDAKDEFETHQYAFAGLDSVLMQFAQQLCGALEIPAVRLFGESPAGFNSGDSDLRNYYDSIRQEQQNCLGHGVEKLYRLAYISTFGKEPPGVFDIEFKPLWQLSTEQKASVANTVAALVNTTFESGLLSKVAALEELKASSRDTGIFTNISDEDIKEAENEPAPSPEALGVKPGEGGKQEGRTPGSSKGTAAESAPGLETGPQKSNVTPFKLRNDRAMDDARGFDPNQKRDDTGKWTLGGGYSRHLKKKDQWHEESGAIASKKVHERIKSLGIAPAYSQVRLNPDYNTKGLQAKALSKAGKWQPTYHPEHHNKQAIIKFKRLKEFNREASKVRDKATKDMNNKSLPERERDTAAVVALIAATGFRPGSDAELGESSKAFGASNLRAAHVKVDGDKLEFHFTGKHGVKQNHRIINPPLAKYIAQKKQEVGRGRLFEAREYNLRSYVKEVSGSYKFKTKDFRTWVGTAEAEKYVREMPRPKNVKAFKLAAKVVATKVGKRLGNNPAQAIKSYIDPAVWSAWGYTIDDLKSKKKAKAA